MIQGFDAQDVVQNNQAGMETIGSFVGIIDGKAIVMGDVVYHHIDTRDGRIKVTNIDRIMERYEEGDYRELNKEDFTPRNAECPNCGSEDVQMEETMSNDSDIFGCRECGDSFYGYEMEEIIYE